MKTKICTKCKTPKNLVFFGKDIKSPDKYNYWCKLCCKKYRTINAEKINIQKLQSKENFPWRYTLYHIKQRCDNPNNERYPEYGGRGIQCLITTAELQFLWFRDKAHLLNSPSIDREDNDGNYELSNCRYMELALNLAERNKRVSSKQVLQYSKDGAVIRKWNSIIQVQNDINISASNIVQCCKGKRVSTGGFIWKYK